MSSHTHHFAEARSAQNVNLRSEEISLVMTQEPAIARVAVGKEKDRKPVDPPPVIELRISPLADPSKTYLSSPFFFMSCSLLASSTSGAPQGTLGTALAGTLVSSLHRLKDNENNDGAYFVFGDLSVKVEGTFRLQFNLYEMTEDSCFHRAAIESKPFPVHSTKSFPGMAESTALTRSFSEQGVRLRLRKEPRTLLRKRGPAHDDYQPRHYQTKNQPSQSRDKPSISIPDSQGSMRPNDQLESIEENQAQNYDQTQPQIGGHFSQHSSVSYPGSASYEESSKRPRTGSDQAQSPAFSHQANHPLGSPQYPPQQAFNPYPQQAQQPAYGFNYTQSPQSATSPRSQFFNRLSTTQSMAPYSQPRPTEASYFPNQRINTSPPQQQQQQAPYGLSQMMRPTSLQRIETNFTDIALLNRTQMSPMTGTPGMRNMEPITWGRTDVSPATYGSLPNSGTTRRESSFQPFGNSNQILPGGNMGIFLGSRSPQINSTTAPGALGSTF